MAPTREDVVSARMTPEEKARWWAFKTKHGFSSHADAMLALVDAYENHEEQFQTALTRDL